MFTEKFAQRTQFIWRIRNHSQAPLISHRTNHGSFLQMHTLVNHPKGFTSHTLSSSPPSGNPNPERPYQVVVAATRDMGIGKDGKLPWNVPSDLKYFKELTTITNAVGKRNAVIMGRKTWESLPQKFRPLPGRLNVVLTRSEKLEFNKMKDLVTCTGLQSALKLLAKDPYSCSIEKVFVIGGGQVLKEALNGAGCEAIHLTDIETNFECDTYIPEISSSLFYKWSTTGPMVENNIRFSFVSYIRRNAESIDRR